MGMLRAPMQAVHRQEDGTWAEHTQMHCSTEDPQPIMTPSRSSKASSIHQPVLRTRPLQGKEPLRQIKRTIDAFFKPGRQGDTVKQKPPTQSAVKDPAGPSPHLLCCPGAL